MPKFYYVAKFVGGQMDGKLLYVPYKKGNIRKWFNFSDWEKRRAVANDHSWHITKDDLLVSHEIPNYYVVEKEQKPTRPEEIFEYTYQPDFKP